MGRAISVLLLLILSFLAQLPFAAKLTTPAFAAQESPAKQSVAKGIWVTVFSKYNILYSPKAINELVDYCTREDISEVYLQVYRAGEAYYDSQLAGRRNYENMLREAGTDPVDFLIKAAHQKNIKVYAWINTLSLAQNQNAPVIKNHGTGILTRDQYKRTSLKTDAADHTDKYYLRDDQLFLEPGDEKVADWTLSVVGELLARYPSFDGLHLDYIRYPFPVPFLPDGRFLEYGLAYGYGERNVARFTQVSGLDPVKGNPYDNDLAIKWDSWKRDQVTALVSKIASLVRGKAPSWEISCAAVPSYERAYSVAFQDWPLWLEKGLMDKVVLMNYTRDERYSMELIKGALAFKGTGKIYSGLGVFLIKDQAAYHRLRDTALGQPLDGIVFFTYDDIRKMEEGK